MRELSKSRYSRRICPPQCVRVIQTRKVRTGQNTSIYHRMNGINGYEFELLFKWVTKLYLWEPRVLRIRFTSVKPKPRSLREALKKLIIPIGANIVFTQKLDKAWIIIDTVVVKPFTSPPSLIVCWIRENLKYGRHLMSRFWSANKWWVLSKRSIQLLELNSHVFSGQSDSPCSLNWSQISPAISTRQPIRDTFNSDLHGNQEFVYFEYWCPFWATYSDITAQ